MLEELKAREKVVGVKQSRRAVRDGLALWVFLAADADPALTGPIREQCRESHVPVTEDYTMEQLGQAAGIKVGAAVVSKYVQIVCVYDDINNNDTLLHFIFGTDCPLHLANL